MKIRPSHIVAFIVYVSVCLSLYVVRTLYGDLIRTGYAFFVLLPPGMLMLSIFTKIEERQFNRYSGISIKKVFGTILYLIVATILIFIYPYDLRLYLVTNMVLLISLTNMFANDGVSGGHVFTIVGIGICVVSILFVSQCNLASINEAKLSIQSEYSDVSYKDVSTRKLAAMLNKKCLFDENANLGVYCFEGKEDNVLYAIYYDPIIKKVIGTQQIVKPRLVEQRRTIK